MTNFNMLRILLTSMIFLRGKFGKAFLIQMISFTFNFEAWVYDFLLLVLVGSFSLAKDSLLSWEGAIGISLDRIGTLGAAWEDVGSLEVFLELGFVVSLMQIKQWAIYL